MEKQTFLVLFCVLGSIFYVDAISHSKNKHDLRLFVFGDSYVDTGNWPKHFGGSWKEPYGITFPGKPCGRFSDGRVLIDYIASILGTKSPITYGGWKGGEKKSIKYGMNFAYGGTGVFNTLVNQPNMSSQIDYFQQVVEEERLLSKPSIAIISIAGNDYATFMATNHTLQGLPSFTKTMINQLVTNVNRIHDIGVRKIGITSMPPLGCLPQFTVTTLYQNCSDRENSVANFHNQVLKESVRKLNNASNNESRFVVVDLYNAFLAALNIQQNHPTGSPHSEMSLEACCNGMTKDYSCGIVDKNTGTKKYNVCKYPKDSFFWDLIHPSQQGWHAVSLHLKSSLRQLH